MPDQGRNATTTTERDLSGLEARGGPFVEASCIPSFGTGTSLRSHWP